MTHPPTVQQQLDELRRKADLVVKEIQTRRDKLRSYWREMRDIAYSVQEAGEQLEHGLRELEDGIDKLSSLL